MATDANAAVSPVAASHTPAATTRLQSASPKAASKQPSTPNPQDPGGLLLALVSGSGSADMVGSCFSWNWSRVGVRRSHKRVNTHTHTHGFTPLAALKPFFLGLYGTEIRRSERSRSFKPHKHAGTVQSNIPLIQTKSSAGPVWLCWKPAGLASAFPWQK